MPCCQDPFSHFFDFETLVREVSAIPIFPFSELMTVSYFENAFHSIFQLAAQQKECPTNEYSG